MLVRIGCAGLCWDGRSMASEGQVSKGAAQHALPVAPHAGHDLGADLFRHPPPSTLSISANPILQATWLSKRSLTPSVSNAC